jgi:hypothetical protein
VAAAIDMRKQYGLRAEVAYVVGVASNPLATTDVLGIPLLPAEVADLRARGADRDKLWSTVQSYGEQHPDTWAGMYLDEAGGGDVVTWFTKDVAMHEAAIRGLTGPFARVRVEPAARTLADLHGKADRIESERAWFTAAGAPLSFAEVSQPDNDVIAYVSSADPHVASTITSHFGGEGWLKVVSDGLGQWTGGTGDLRIQLVDPAGDAVGPKGDDEWHCKVKPDDPAAWSGGPGVAGPNGICTFSDPLGATGYDVTVVRLSGLDEQVIGRSRVTVVKDRTTDITIRVTEP